MRIRERNDTERKAVSHVNREWREMADLALRIRTGRCSVEYADKNMGRFTGIFKRLLEDPEEELVRYARK